MEDLKVVSRHAILSSNVHCWDTHARRMVCGAPGQIGSTKHVRDVTCGACLEVLGRPARAAFHVMPR